MLLQRDLLTEGFDLLARFGQAAFALAQLETGIEAADTRSCTSLSVSSRWASVRRATPSCSFRRAHWK